MKKILAAMTLAAFTMVVTPSFAQAPSEQPNKEEKKDTKKKRKEAKKEAKK